MDSRSPAYHMLMAAALASMAVFAYDSAVKGLWAGLTFALLACTVLLAVIGAVQRRGTLAATSAANPAAEGGKDLRVLLDHVPIPLVRHVDGHHPEAINRAARNLFRTDDVIVSDSGKLAGAIAEATRGSGTTLSVFDRQ